MRCMKFEWAERHHLGRCLGPPTGIERVFAEPGAVAYHRLKRMIRSPVCSPVSNTLDCGAAPCWGLDLPAPHGLTHSACTMHHCIDLHAAEHHEPVVEIGLVFN